MTDAAKVAALREALERLRDGVVAMKNAIPLQSLGPEWRPFLGRTGEVNQALDLADAALSASDSGEVAGLLALVEHGHHPYWGAKMIRTTPGASDPAMRGDNPKRWCREDEEAWPCSKVRAALTRPVSETPEGERVRAALVELLEAAEFPLAAHDMSAMSKAEVEQLWINADIRWLDARKKARQTLEGASDD